MNTKTKKLVMTALMAALTCIATMIIVIPSPLKGYINLGDCLVLTSGWILSPAYGFFAAGLFDQRLNGADRRLWFSIIK